MSCDCNALNAKLDSILAGIDRLSKDLSGIKKRLSDLEKNAIRKPDFGRLLKGSGGIIGAIALGTFTTEAGIPLAELKPLQQTVKKVAPFADKADEVFTAVRDVKRFKLDLAGVQKDVSSVKQEFTAVRRQAAKAVELADDAFDAAEATVDIVDGKIKGISRTANQALSTATAAGASAAAATAQAAAVAAQVASIAAALAGVATSFVLANELRRAINNMRAELQREAQALYNLILTNQQRSIDRDAEIRAQLERFIQSLNTKVSALSARVATNTRTLTDLNGRTVTLERRQTATEQKVATNTQTLTQVQTGVKTNTRTITNLQGRTITLERQQTATDQKVATNTRSITQLQTDTATNFRTITSNLTQFRTNITTNTTNITNIQQRLNNVPQIIRVPQPYPVTRTIERVRVERVEVPRPYPVNNTRTITNTKIQKVEVPQPYPVTRTITNTKIQKVEVPGQATQTKLSTSDLTKIGAAACVAVRTCNPDSETLKRIEDKLGDPFATPQTLLNDGKDNLIRHKSFASIMSWWIRQMDMLFGEFPIKIEIEDSDLLKAGDQGGLVKIPNVAECLAELLGNTINSKAANEAGLDAIMRVLMEAGSGRKQAIVNHHLLTAIQEYLGFSCRQKIIEVPFTYNPIDAIKKDSIAQALKKSNQKIKVEENADIETLEKQMKALMEAARITKAVHVRKLSPENVEDWKAMMRASRDQLDRTDPNQEEDDFDKFLRNVEEGWTGVTGNDPTAPYDRNMEERPQIRRLKPEDNNDGNR